MKKILAVLILAAMLIAMVACNGDNNQTNPNDANVTTPADEGAKEKTFTSNGLTITLTEDFKKTTQPGYTVCYDSKSVAVIALKESFSLAAGVEDWTLEYYASLIKSNNAANSPTNPKKVGDRMVMEYTFYNPDTQITYHYYTCMYKGSDAFWMIQFACDVNELEEYKPYMIEWADSVRV